jgi:hypothetical protein
VFLRYISLEREKDRQREAALQERNDLLVSALGRRSQIDVNFPVPPPKVLEEGSGWWDKKPPKVEIVFNPTKGA